MSSKWCSVLRIIAAWKTYRNSELWLLNVILFLLFTCVFIYEPFFNGSGLVFSPSGFGLKKNVRSGSEQKNLDPKHWLKQFPLHYFSFSSQVYHLYSQLCFSLIVPCLNYQGKFLSKQELKFAVREVRRVQVGQTIFFFFLPKITADTWKGWRSDSITDLVAIELPVSFCLFRWPDSFLTF